MWSINASVTGGWRTRNADPDLIGPGDGGTGSSHRLGNKNFDKGDNFSTLLRVIGDVNLRKDDYGVMLRAKAWDNYRPSSRSVQFGAPSNDYIANTELNDLRLRQNLVEVPRRRAARRLRLRQLRHRRDTQAKVRLGQHVVNFGEACSCRGSTSTRCST